LADKAPKSAIVDLRHEISIHYVSNIALRDNGVQNKKQQLALEASIDDIYSQLTGQSDKMRRQIEDMLSEIIDRKMENYDKICRQFGKFFN